MIIKSGDTRMKHTLPPLVFKYFALVYKVDAEISAIRRGEFEGNQSNIDLIKVF